MPKRPKDLKLGVPIRLNVAERYIQFNRQYAVRDVFDGLVELITNSDDSYQRLFKNGRRNNDGGPILIEYLEQRNERPSLIKVRDRAEGMTLDEMMLKLGTLGDRYNREGDRGFMGRGARDCTELGEMLIESIKDDRYYACKITPSTHIIRLNNGDKVDDELRDKLGLRRRDNGTVVTLNIEPRHKMPRMTRLMRDLPWHFALRDITSEESATQVSLRNLNDRDAEIKSLVYRQSHGELVVDEDFEVPGYSGVYARLTVWRAPKPFDTTGDRRFRRSGLLVKGKRAIHECSLLTPEFEHDPNAARYFGRLTCHYIDDLLKEYDDCLANGTAYPNYNPRLLIDPNRQGGLIREHPFTQALFQIPTEKLRVLVAKDRQTERAQRSELANRETKRRLTRLAKAASRFMQQQIEEIDDLTPGVDMDIPPSGKWDVMIIPTYVRLALGEEKTLSMYVSRELTSSEKLEATVSVDDRALTVLNPTFELTPHPKKEDRLIGTFRIQADGLSDGIYVQAKVDGLPPAEAIVEIVEPGIQLRNFENLLEFEHVQYRVRQGSSRKLRLYAMYPDLVSKETSVEVWSEDTGSVVVRGRYQLEPVANSNFAQADVVVEGRRLNANVKIRAFVNGREACAQVRVTEKDRGSAPIKIEIRNDDYGNFRAIWADHEGQPNLLLISAKHKSLKRYLGPHPEFEGQNSPVFRLLLAEIVAESVCRKLLRSEAQKHPWEFELTGDALAIVDGVFFQLHRRIRDFVAEAHAVMLSDSEIKNLS